MRRAFFLRGGRDAAFRKSETIGMAGAADRAANPLRAFDHRCSGGPMVTTTRFGRKLKLPSTVQIKRELLLRWRADQEAKEAAEATDKARAAAATDAIELIDQGKPHVQS